MRPIVLAALFILMPVAAVAQAAPTASPAPAPSSTPAAGVSDPCTTTLAVVSRPSVTTSVCVVKPGHVMIETGYQNTTLDGGTSTAQYPQALIRAGTSVPNLEISVAPPSLNRSAGANGTSDTSFGAKYEIGYSSKWLYGVNAYVTEPTGLAGYSAGGTGYTANANLNYALTPGFSLTGTFGYNRLSDGTHRYTSIIPSLVLGAMVAGTTSLFGEVASFSHALGPIAGTRVQYLAGIQQSFANKLQIDLEAGRSPTATTGKYRYVGAGVNYYF